MITIIKDNCQFTVNGAHFINWVNRQPMHFDLGQDESYTMPEAQVGVCEYCGIHFSQ